MDDIKYKVKNREILYNDINKAKFELIPLFLKDKNVIKFKSYNELIHTIILLYLYIGAAYNTKVTVIDMVTRKMSNKTYSFYVDPITARPPNILNKLRGRAFDGKLIVFIKSDIDLEPSLENDIFASINMSSKGGANIVTCIL